MAIATRQWAELTLTGLLALALVSCGGEKPAGAAGAAGGAAPPPPEVQVVTVAPGAATMTQDLPGRLEAVRTAQVRARVEGVVERRLFEEGSDVAAGKSLYLIDPRTYQAAAAAAEADVAVARLTVDRYRPLLEIKAVSQQEFDQAMAALKQAEATLIKAKLDLENANVLAPISGRIGRSAVTEGALVGKGDATLLATIEQLDPIYVNFTQSGSDVMRLQQAIKSGRLKRAEGSRVQLILEDGSIYAQPGRMMFSDLAVDPNTGTIQMRAQFPNPGRQLLPGTFLRVRVPQAEAEGVVKVPQQAVQANPQGQFVMIVDGEGKVVVRPVKTGSMAGPDWILNEGLKGGEQVIVSGLQKVRPGAPAKPVPLNAAPSAPESAPAASGK